VKSLRKNPPAVRTHGLRKIGKIKHIKPPHEHAWNFIEDWPDHLTRQHCVLYRCGECGASMLRRLDQDKNEVSRVIKHGDQC